MSNELTLNASMVFDDDITDADLQIVDRLVTISTKTFVKDVQTIGIAEEAIDLGELTTVGWAFFKNLDPTNFITLKVATGGAIFAKLRPDTNSDGKGGFALLELGSGAQVPFAIADTAPCRLAYLLIAP